MKYSVKSDEVFRIVKRLLESSLDGPDSPGDGFVAAALGLLVALEDD